MGKRRGLCILPSRGRFAFPGKRREARDKKKPQKAAQDLATGHKGQMLQQGLCRRLNSHFLGSRTSPSTRHIPPCNTSALSSAGKVREESLLGSCMGFKVWGFDLLILFKRGCSYSWGWRGHSVFVPRKVWQKQLCKSGRCRHKVAPAEKGTLRCPLSSPCLCVDDCLPPCWGAPQCSWCHGCGVTVGLTGELFSTWFSLNLSGFFFFPFLLFELGFIGEKE